MQRTNAIRGHKLAQAVLVLSLQLVSTIGYVPLVYAQSWSGGGSPSGQRGGGSQGGCDLNNANQENVTALIPKTRDLITTVDAHPTFWFYVPFQASEFASLKFVLQSSDRKPLYEFPIAASASPGIISIRLPDAAPNLEPNKTYRWGLILNCKAGSTLEIRNTVTRQPISPAMAQELSAASTAEAKAAVYTKYRIWLNTVTVLGDRRRTNPTDSAVSNAWKALLSDTGVSLADLASKPIVNCCQPTP